MSKRPLVASPRWTPLEDEKLLTLAASGERPATIAEQLQRSAAAVRHRFNKLGIPLNRIRTGRAKGDKRSFASHHERQFLEYLRGTGWVKGRTLPSTSRLLSDLLKRGWVEERHQDNEMFFRMTDVGLAALKAPVPIQKSWAK